MKTEDREFLLEVYRQVLEHQREADRKRDRLISIYVPSGSLLWFLIQFRFLQIPQLDRSSFRWVSISWLVISGIVFYILHFYRRWHVDYHNIATAIHRSIMVGRTTDVYNTFETLVYNQFRVKKKERKKTGFSPYISSGVELSMAILVLAIAFLVLLALFSITCRGWIMLKSVLGAVLAVEFIILYLMLLDLRKRKIKKDPKRLLGWYLQNNQEKEGETRNPSGTREEVDNG